MLFHWVHHPVVAALIAAAMRARVAMTPRVRSALCCRGPHDPRSGRLGAHWLIDDSVRSGS
jgi:hypothetical protein